MNTQVTTIEIKDVTYRIGKLNAMQQFHLTRRLLPIFAVMGISISQLRSGAKLDLSEFLPILEPLSKIMAAMSDADSNYIILTCLGVVQRGSEGGKWAPLTTETGQFMFPLDMAEMLRLVVEVLRDNLGNFLKGLGAETESPSS
jgi:hypothetical protein